MSENWSWKVARNSSSMWAFGRISLCRTTNQIRFHILIRIVAGLKSWRSGWSQLPNSFDIIKNVQKLTIFEKNASKSIDNTVLGQYLEIGCVQQAPIYGFGRSKIIMNCRWDMGDKLSKDHLMMKIHLSGKSFRIIVFKIHLYSYLKMSL